MANDLKNKSVSIYIDDAPAKASLQRLQKNQDDLNGKIAEAKKRQLELNQAIEKAKVSGKSYDDLQKKLENVNDDLKDCNKALAENTNRQKSLEERIKNGVGPSLKEQSGYVRQLYNEYSRLGSNTDEAREALEKYLTEASKLEDMKQRMKASKQQSDSFTGSFLGNLAADATSSVVGFFKDKLSSAVSDNTKLSDEFSDIEKSTGLSAAGVARLNAELEKLDTRTKSEDLRGIAVGLGQIGEEATAANVAAIDKIVVALGDEFGGDANNITKEVSILRNNLQDVKSGNYSEDVAKIANALNVLGAEGLASAPVVTDFANRMAGVAGTFKLSSGQILGTGAAFQELGITAERGSTAFVALLQRISAEPAKFAKVTDMSVKEFKDLVNNDLLGAFIKVSEGAKKAGADNVTFAKILKELDADGSGAGEVLSKVAANAELLRNKVNLASESLKSTTSITDEFNKKNENAAALYEKFIKSVSSIFTGGAFLAGLTKLLALMVEIVAPAKTLTDSFRKQQDAVNDLEKNTVPLINRYDELKNKANQLGGVSKLSKNEQVELNKAIISIGNTIPGAITQFDKYGNAIAISSEKARTFIDLQKAILKEKNRDAISEQKNLQKELEKEMQKNIDMANGLIKHANGEGGDLVKRQIRDGYAKQSDYESYIARQTAFAQTFLKKNVEIEERLKGIRGITDELTGDNLKVPEVKKPEDTNTNNKPNFPFEDKKLEQLRKEYEKFLRGIENDTLKSKVPDALLPIIEAFNKTKEALNELNELRKKGAVSDSEYAKTTEAIYKRQAAAIAKASEDEKAKFSTKTLVNDSTVSSDSLPPALAKTLLKLPKNIVEIPIKLAAPKASPEELKQLKTEFGKIMGRIQKETGESYQLDVVNASKTYAPLKKRDALLSQLEWEKSQELNNAKLTATEKELIENKYLEKRREINNNFNQQVFAGISQAIQFAQQALSVYELFNTGKNNKENAELKKELKDNDAKKAALKKMLNSKLITQQEYNSKVAALDEEADKKKQALEKKQFDRNKKIQFAQAAANGAMAIVSTLAARPGAVDILSLGAIRAIQIGLVAATTLAQLKVISDSKYEADTPSYGKGGAFLFGPSHEEDGMPIINPKTGKVVANVEGNEVILSKKTVENNPGIVGELLYNSMHRNGAKIRPLYQPSPYTALNYSSMTESIGKVRRLATGGWIPNNTGQSFNSAQQPDSSTATSTNLEAHFESVTNLLQTMITVLQQPNRNYVVLKDLEKSENTLAQIKADATFKSSRSK